MNPNEPIVTKPYNYDSQHGIISIDDDDVHWKFKFTISMLRLARILTFKEAEIWGVRAAKVSKLMDKHRNVMHCSYTPLQIREQFWLNADEIRGGGFKVEWHPIDLPHRRNDPPHYSISFTRLYQLKVAPI